jgi:flagellar P-ring protein precursor FlgI
VPKISVSPQGLFRLRYLLFVIVFAAVTLFPTAQAERVKDLASIAGVRDNQILGYGLVVGLEGTGDSTGQVQFTEQSLRSMLSQYGVTIPPGMQIKPKNVAAVSVHATIPPFSKPGQRLDVTVSSLGNSSSLRGGALLLTPLRGIDGAVYAIAQGEVVVGGVNAAGADGTNVQKNISSAGRIPNGATIEREVGNGFDQSSDITLNLHSPDFTTARRVVEAINLRLGGPQAHAKDAVSIVVRGPGDSASRVTFVSILENIEVTPASTVARIVVNSRTGTIVIGQHVTVTPAAVSHGNITVTIKEQVNVDQPQPLAGGQTAVTNNSTVNISEQGGSIQTISGGVTLQEVVDSLNDVGANTSDLIAILEALKQLGALRGELVII